MDNQTDPGLPLLVSCHGQAPTSCPPASIPKRTSRTRFVCISDTHNCTVKLPKGDVLIHAGDLTNQGSYSELSKAIQWLEKADFETKIVIAGNHDITLEKEFYTEYGKYFHNKEPQDPDKCISLLKNSPTITYLCHEFATVRLTNPKGPRTRFTVFGSPFSPRDGRWAFSYNATADVHPSLSSASTKEQSLPADRTGLTALELWSQIPLDTDILITHTPPHTHCDESASRRRAAGCEILRQTLWRVRPRVHVCGHVHDGRGADRVQWGLDGSSGSANVAYSESKVECWQDPSPELKSTKISLLDLTARSGNRALDNDGSYHEALGELLKEHLQLDTLKRLEPSKLKSLVGDAHYGHSPPSHSQSQTKAQLALQLQLQTQESPTTDTKPSFKPTSKAPIDKLEVPLRIGVEPGIGTRGLGGNPTISPRCDREALLGRMGRRETCIVNCAVVATSWPHTGGKRFNKPIVVDLDLPVWADELEGGT